MEEKIFYKSTDNIKLCGLLGKFSNDNSIIIMCHGINGNKDEIGSFAKLSNKLHSYGYNTFRFDFRSHGESQGIDYELTPLKELEDIYSTINYLKEQGFDRFIILGASFGASIVSMINYSTCSEIKGIILWYGALDYTRTNGYFLNEHKEIAEKEGYYPLVSKRSGNILRLGKEFFNQINEIVPYNYLININKPILFVHGNKDETVPYELSKEVCNKCINSKISIIENGDHSFSKNEEVRNKAIHVTIEFIEDLLKNGRC